MMELRVSCCHDKQDLSKRKRIAFSQLSVGMSRTNLIKPLLGHFDIALLPSFSFSQCYSSSLFAHVLLFFFLSPVFVAEASVETNRTIA